MKYDSDGVVCGLDPLEHIKAFLCKEEATRYFQMLKRGLNWSEISWSGQDSIPRLVFYYHELERQTRSNVILEELILLIEEVFETNIGRVECSLYRHGDDYRPYHQDFRGKHVFIMSLGNTRKVALKEINSTEGKVFTMNHGDVLYSSSQASLKYNFSCIRDPLITKSQIELIFFTDVPYINRTQHLRYMNVLGIGQIPVWFQGSSQEWTKDLTAAVLPASFNQIIGGTLHHPMEDNLRPVEISIEYA